MGEQLVVRPADPSDHRTVATPFDEDAIRRFVARHLLAMPIEDLDADDAPFVDGHRPAGAAYIAPSGIRVDVGPGAIVFHEGGSAAEQTIFAALNEVGGIAVDADHALAISCDPSWLDAGASPANTLVVVSTITELREAMRMGANRSGIVDGRT